MPVILLSSPLTKPGLHRYIYFRLFTNRTIPLKCQYKSVQNTAILYGIVRRIPQRTKRPSDCKIQWHDIKYPEQRTEFRTDARNCDCAEVTQSRFCVILLRDNLTEDFAGEQLFQNGDGRVRVFHHAIFHPIEQHTGHSMCIKS